MTKPEVKRHLTAIGRQEYSRPVQLALEAGLINQETTVLDYGCGLGDDVKRLQAEGVDVKGWDPAHNPDEIKRRSAVVNLGYVVNVIEKPLERRKTLRAAWKLTKQLLVVSARMTYEANAAEGKTFSDGILTQRSTFQKFYRQDELRDWIDQTLEVTAVAAAPGIFFIFRDELLKQEFLASRVWFRRAAPRLRKSDALFEQHRDLLEPLIRFHTDHARLPKEWELEETEAISEVFGSLPRAFGVIRRVTGSEQWDTIRVERYNELLVYFALDRFGGRPRFKELPRSLQVDVREFFSSYKKAGFNSARLLFAAGKTDSINEAMKAAQVGKLTPTALYIHADYIHILPPVLRVYEGCARAYVGSVDSANIIKLYRKEARISYLAYPDFDEDPHPALEKSLLVSLGDLAVKYTSYHDSENPPILHRKELFISTEDPRWDKFRKITQLEEELGLYEEPRKIGTRKAWQDLLKKKRIRL